MTTAEQKKDQHFKYWKNSKKKTQKKTLYYFHRRRIKISDKNEDASNK